MTYLLMRVYELEFLRTAGQAVNRVSPRRNCLEDSEVYGFEDDTMLLRLCRYLRILPPHPDEHPIKRHVRILLWWVHFSWLYLWLGPEACASMMGKHPTYLIPTPVCYAMLVRAKAVRFVTQRLHNAILNMSNKLKCLINTFTHPIPHSSIWKLYRWYHHQTNVDAWQR